MISKFELIDQYPEENNEIPIRMFLSGYTITPTYKGINNKYSVSYYLKLAIIDEEDKQYFKGQEINFWRKK